MPPQTRTADVDRRRRQNIVATAALLAAAIALGLIAANQSLVDRALVGLFGAAQDPVFATPLLTMVGRHLLIVAVSSALTLAVGIPLGIWVTRRSGEEFRDIVSAGVDFGQVFPPIAVLALMLPVLGIGLAPAVVALFLYGLLPVVSGVVSGLESVPAAVVDAARGMGMSRWRVLFTIELPLASPVIFAGVRTSVIINVGTATVAAATGAGGLGLPIFTGISTQNPGNTLEGALAVTALALVLDGALAVLGGWLQPRGSE